MNQKLNNVEKALHRQIRRDAFTKLGLVFLGILIIADTIQIARFGEIVERVDHYNGGVVDELGGFRQDISLFAQDMNEMRSFLLLPTKDYSFIEKNTEISSEEKDATPTEQAMYQFLGAFVAEQTSAANLAYANEHIGVIAGDERMVKAAADLTLTIGKIEDNQTSKFFKLSTANSVPLFTLLIEKNTGKILIQSALETKEIVRNPDDIQQIVEYLTQNREAAEKMKLLLEERRAMISAATKSPEAVAAAQQKKLFFTEQPQYEQAEKDAWLYHYTNEESTRVVTIALARKDAAVTIGSKVFNTPDELKAGLLEALNAADSSTQMEKMIQNVRAELQKVFNEDAFKELLKTSNLTIQTEPREEYNKLLYDVKNAQGKTEFSFVVELSSGHLKVLRNNQEIDLASLLQPYDQLGSKKKP